MTINIAFHNTELFESIEARKQCVQDAIDYKLPDSAQRELDTLVDLVSTSKCIYGDEIGDLEQDLQIFVERVSQLQLPVQPQRHRAPNAARFPRPVGIERIETENHCPENAMAQLLSDTELVPNQLRPYMNVVHKAQVDQKTVPHTFGSTFRRVVGNLLNDGLRNDWLREGSFSSASQVDILGPLARIIELSKKPIEYTKYTTIQEEFTFESGNHKDFLIRLDMTEDEPFTTKFENSFSQSIFGGREKESFKFINPPSDLVIAANRQIHIGLSQRKNSTPIKDVPELLVVKPELTVDGQGALYEISGCIIHHGQDDSGHYTALRKVGNTWYHINDSIVEDVIDPQPYLAQGYVFHYQKLETSNQTFIPSEPKQPVVQITPPNQIEFEVQDSSEDIPEEAPTCMEQILSGIQFIWSYVQKPFEANNDVTREKKDS